MRSSMDRRARMAGIIRLTRAISTTRLNGGTGVARLYRMDMMPRLTSFPRLDSMTGMLRNTRLTRMVKLTRLHIHIRGYGYG